MDRRLVVHGLDLSELGIGDAVGGGWVSLEAVLDGLAREVLGSITFGPIRVVDLGVGDIEDDVDWPFAE